MTGHELGAWSALACLLLALGLVQFASARRALVTLGGEWLLQQVDAEPDVDQDALDLYHALRRQRLLEHVARLRRILADDSHQSATRQLGNRLAYGQLLAELAGMAVLAELAEGGPMARLPLTTVEDGASWATTVAVAGRGGGNQYAPRVEVLDFGRPGRS